MKAPLRTLRAILGRLFQSAGVGALASAVDFGALFLLVNVARMPALAANVPALLVGLVVQFIGARYVVFRASETKLSKQLVGFAVTELGSLALNALVFHFLVLLTPMPYLLARIVGSFLVFVSFSFPMWTFVFRPTPR